MLDTKSKISFMSGIVRLPVEHAYAKSINAVWSMVVIAGVNTYAVSRVDTLQN